MKTRQALLSHLSRTWSRYPQLITNIKVREKKPFDQIDGVLQLVEQAEAEIKPTGGRVLLRYAGTEPKVRLLIEGRDSAIIERWSKKIMDTLKQNLGA